MSGVFARRHRRRGDYQKGDRDEAELKIWREPFFNLTSAARHPSLIFDFLFRICDLIFAIS